MMEESLEAILALLRSDEPVTRETDWFTMREARLQMPARTPTRTSRSPWPRWCRRRGRASPASTACRCCRCRCRCSRASPPSARRGTSSRTWPPGTGSPMPDRQSWRVLGIMHLAETRDQAIEDCTYGLEDFANYFGGGAGFVPLANAVDDEPKTKREFVEEYAGVGQRRDRHARRRHRLHRGPPRAVGRLRHLPAARPRLGRARGHDALVPALRPGGHPPLHRASWRPPRTSHEWAICQAGRTCSAGPGRRSWTPSPTHVEEQRRRRPTQRRCAIVKAAVLRDGERGRPRRRGRARRRASARCSCRCGRAASAARTSTSPSTAPRCWSCRGQMEGSPISAPAPELDLGRTSSWATSSPARCWRSARTPRARRRARS